MSCMSQDERPRTYKVPDNIAWVDGVDLGMADELYLTVVPSGGTVMLKNTARLIWLAAMRGSSVIDGVDGIVGLPTTRIAGQVAEFLSELASNGLLRAPEPHR